MDFFIVFPFFLKYLANAECMINSRPSLSILVDLISRYIYSNLSQVNCMNHSPDSRPGIHNGVSDRILYSRPSRIKVASKRDHSSIDKRRQGCYGDLRTSVYETVDALCSYQRLSFFNCNCSRICGSAALNGSMPSN